MHDLVYQLNALEVLNKHRTSINNVELKKIDFKLSVLIFDDASQQINRRQLSYLGGLFFGNLESGSVFHTLSCSPKKFWRPVKSPTSCELLAAGRL